MSCKELFQAIIPILQTLGIIGALIVSIFALIISKKDITSRLRPYVFIDKFHLDTICKNKPSNIIAFDYEMILKNIGQTPAIIKNIEIKETLSRNPELLKGRKVNLRDEQVIYPDNNIHVAVPRIGTEIAKLMCQYKKEDIYNAKIVIIYSQLGTKKEYIFERSYSLNPNLVTAPKFGLKSIGRIN